MRGIWSHLRLISCTPTNIRGLKAMTYSFAMQPHGPLSEGFSTGVPVTPWGVDGSGRPRPQAVLAREKSTMVGMGNLGGPGRAVVEPFGIAVLRVGSGMKLLADKAVLGSATRFGEG